MNIYSNDEDINKNNTFGYNILEEQESQTDLTQNNPQQMEIREDNLNNS